MLPSTESPPSPGWPRDPTRALLTLAWPIVVSMLSVSTMTLVDTLFVSRLGPAPVAAVGLAGVVGFTFWALPLGYIRATKILVAQAVGAGQEPRHRVYLGGALVSAIGLGAVFTALALLAAPELSRVAATPLFGELASQYLATRAIGTIPFLLLIALEETRQGLSDSRSVMATTLLGNASNVVLDYCFIFVLEGGVAGAAWASNCSLVIELVALGFLHGRKSGFSGVAPRMAELRELWGLGVPSALQFGLEVGAFAMVSGILAGFSETHAAANQIAIQVLHFCFLPCLGLSEAASVLVGQAVGGRQLVRVMPVARAAYRVALLYTLVCGLVLLSCAPYLAAIFTRETALAGIVAQLLLILAVVQVVDGVGLVTRGVLRGAGDVRYVATIGVVTSWLCTPPFAYLLGHQLGWGVFGAWTGIAVELAIGTGLLFRRLHGGDWKLLPAR